MSNNKSNVIGPAKKPDNKEGFDFSLDKEEFLKQMDNIPLFMTSVPTEKENIALEALQSLKFDGTNEEIASNQKEHGNYCFKIGKYKEAVLSYTEGIEQNCSDKILNSVLFSNRALANLKLCNKIKHIDNYSKCVSDCLKSIELNDKNIKAYHRIVEAYYRIDKLEQCIEYCSKVIEQELVKEEKKEYYLEYLKKSQTKLEAFEKEVKKRKERETKKKINTILYNKILENRNVRDISKKQYRIVDLDNENVVKIDKTDNIFVVGYKSVFYYPEFKQTDALECFYENITFKEQLNYMFETPPHWDTLSHYANPKHIFCCFEYYHNNNIYPSLVEIDSNSSLQAIIADHRFGLDVNVGCQFFVFSRKNKFYEKYKTQIESQ